MPQSLSSVLVHIVFSTKDRQPFLNDRRLRNDTHSYLGGICKQLDCAPIQIGGMADHVHILARQSRIITLADWVKELKRSSSLWIKEKSSGLDSFHWQAGYGAFSVSQSQSPRVGEYIAHQEHHHQQMTYQDELRSMFRKHDIEFNERFVWD